ncbi:MAG: hypothetical protein JNK10_14290, partial [Cyclobacteriaceae bacterium]|nr:hypothetical protein [Cyclobacteriaceae bacterium]
MKKLILLFVLSVSFHGITEAQAPAQTTDPKYFDKLRWRNIGPQRGGRSLGASGSPGRPNEYYFGATG